MSYNPSTATIPVRNRSFSSSTTQIWETFSTIRSLGFSPFARHYLGNHNPHATHKKILISNSHFQFVLDSEFSAQNSLMHSTRLSFSFPPVTEMVHFTGCPPHNYVFIIGSRAKHEGFPHSEISGLKCLFASYPKLIAGYHVLHRLYLPRHPPYALKCFTLIKFYEFNETGIKLKC